MTHRIMTSQRTMTAPPEEDEFAQLGIMNILATMDPRRLSLEHVTQ